MRKALIGGAALLLCGVISARSKNDPLVFVFLRADAKQDVAVLRPMIAPDIAVQLDSGARTLAPGEVLRCQTSVREHSAIVDGQAAKVSELLLDCSEHQFVVRALDFTPRAK